MWQMENHVCLLMEGCKHLQLTVFIRVNDASIRNPRRRVAAVIPLKTVEKQWQEEVNTTPFRTHSNTQTPLF